MTTQDQAATRGPTGSPPGPEAREEIVTHSLVRDVDLPGGAGTLALITLDNGYDHTKPTTLGPSGMAELAEAIDRLRHRAVDGQISAVAVTGRPFVFAVGADLTQVGRVHTREDALAIATMGHRVLGALSDLPVPTFAFVNGAVLGGGLELALACTYRTMSSAVTMVAFPECFLGLVPGWGGCWRLPRLVGVETALRLIVENPLAQNRMISGDTAVDLGVADVLLDPADFLVQSVRWAARVLRGEQEVTRPEIDRDETRWTGAVEAARAQVLARTGGAAPAPVRACDLISAARADDRATGEAAEDEALADLLMGDELRASLYAFDLVNKRARKPAGAPAAAPRPVTKIGIVGAGLMASQLALLFVRRLQVPVVLTDLDAERVETGLRYVTDEMKRQEAKGRLTAHESLRYAALVTGSTDLAVFADADLVIEAVYEELAVKQAVFAQVEEYVGHQTILATNTSSLSVTEMARGLRHPERVVGMHFFNPVAVMPLLEIVRTELADETSVSTALAVAKGLRKTAILVADSPSFIVNRLLGRFLSDVGLMVDEGADLATVDSAFAGVTPMTPFTLIELVGPAIALHNNASLARAYPGRITAPASLRALVDSGLRGIHVREDGRTRVDPRALAAMPQPEHPRELTAEQVRRRALEGLADEARRMVDEGVVAAPMDVDLAMITGAGFLFVNGGLTPLLDRTGIAEAVTGRRFLPARLAEAPHEA